MTVCALTYYLRIGYKKAYQQPSPGNCSRVTVAIEEKQADGLMGSEIDYFVKGKDRVCHPGARDICTSVYRLTGSLSNFRGSLT